MKLTHIATAIMVGALAVPVAAQAAGEMDKAKSAVKDSWITTKIKAEFVKDKTVKATKIKVETESAGVVTLGGTAKTQAEVDRAVSIAKNVKGVTDVTNNIQISNS
ncbi:MAG TPA: BON domain-containing protein [Burkholderiales bacterium]|jgi:osmotically-inducible protein OsmY